MRECVIEEEKTLPAGKFKIKQQCKQDNRFEQLLVETEREEDTSASFSSSRQGGSLAGLESSERVVEEEEEEEETAITSTRQLQRSKTKAAAGTVKNLLTKFDKKKSANLPVVGEEKEILPGLPEESETENVRMESKSVKYQPRASIKAAPGTVRNLRANFEKK